MRKVRRARALLDAAGSRADLQVDGGVSAENIAALTEAGANVFVTGSSVYTPKRSVAEAVAALRAALQPLESRPPRG